MKSFQWAEDQPSMSTTQFGNWHEQVKGHVSQGRPIGSMKACAVPAGAQYVQMASNSFTGLNTQRKKHPNSGKSHIQPRCWQCKTVRKQKHVCWQLLWCTAPLWKLVDIRLEICFIMLCLCQVKERGWGEDVKPCKEVCFAVKLVNLEWYIHLQPPYFLSY